MLLPPVAASALIVLALLTTTAAAANTVGLPSTVQDLEHRVRTSLADVGSDPDPGPAAQPNQELFRTNLTQRFDGVLTAPPLPCAPGEAALAVVAARAPQIVGGAISAWHRMDHWLGGRPVSASVGLGKEVLGVSNGRVVADRWIDFHINVGLFRRSAMRPTQDSSPGCLSY